VFPNERHLRLLKTEALPISLFLHAVATLDELCLLGLDITLHKKAGGQFGYSFYAMTYYPPLS
jgi:hypothetical protein